MFIPRKKHNKTLKSPIIEKETGVPAISVRVGKFVEAFFANDLP